MEMFFNGNPVTSVFCNGVEMDSVATGGEVVWEGDIPNTPEECVLEAPTNLKASDCEFVSKVELTWDFTQQNIAYTQVLRNMEPIAIVDGLSFNDTSVMYGETYSYLVRAKCKTVEDLYGASSNTVLGCSKDELVLLRPDTPTNLTATINLPNRVELVWDAVPNTINYSIYKDGSWLIDTSISNYKDYSVVLDQYYLYEVVANNQYGSSEKSTTAIGNIEEEAILSPLSFTVTDGTLVNQVSCSWERNHEGSTPTQYNIYRDNVLMSSVSGSASSEILLVEDHPGKVFTYSIIAENVTGDKSEALEDTGWARPDATIPDASDNLHIDKIDISWDAIKGEDIYYFLYRATDWSGTNKKLIATTNGTAFQDAGLTADTSYIYAIVAGRGNNQDYLGYASNATVGSTKAIAPGSVTITEEGYWIVPEGVTQIAVCMVGGGGGGSVCENLSLTTAAGGGYAGVITSGFLDLWPGYSLKVQIGGGGAGAPSNSGWGVQGGWTALRKGDDHDVVLMSAEGGAGGKHGHSGTNSPGYNGNGYSRPTCNGNFIDGFRTFAGRSNTWGGQAGLGEGGGGSLDWGYTEAEHGAGGGGGAKVSQTRGGTGGNGAVIISWGY